MDLLRGDLLAEEGPPAELGKGEVGGARHCVSASPDRPGPVDVRANDLTAMVEHDGRAIRSSVDRAPRFLCVAGRIRIRQSPRSRFLVRLGLRLFRGLGRLVLLALAPLEIVIRFAGYVRRSGYRGPGMGKTPSLMTHPSQLH